MFFSAFSSVFISLPLPLTTTFFFFLFFLDKAIKSSGGVTKGMLKDDKATEEAVEEAKQAVDAAKVKR